MTKEEHEFALMPKEIIEVKDRILDELEGDSTATIIMALMSTLIEVIVRTAPSKESALETINHMSISMIASVKACDDAGLCEWNTKRQ